MHNILSMPAAQATLDEDAWDDLLNFIQEHLVIPIIGPELLRVDTPSGPCPLYSWIAEKLALRLELDTAMLPEQYTLNDVVGWYLATHGRRETVYARLYSIVHGASFEPPKALRLLAQITDFNLYVSTTFDSLLETALNEERFGGQPSAEIIAYAPNRVVDLPAEREQLQRPVIYHLLGRLSASPTYVISDEDLLEFVCALQSEHLTPEKLFHALEHNHLLFIGGSFSNWLARIFLRMLKRHRLSDPRDVGEVLADTHSFENKRLMNFLQQVSVRTKVYGGDEMFVSELHRRWTARQGSGKGSAAPFSVSVHGPAREMPDDAVFISYAHEDLQAVTRLRRGLEQAGLTVWFDVARLEAGDDFDCKIRRNIARCSYFIPIVSASTELRREGYFRREWNYAIDRSRNMADEALFIVPVTIDDTEFNRALVPDKFRSLHFTRLMQGEVTPEFLRVLKDAPR